MSKSCQNDAKRSKRNHVGKKSGVVSQSVDSNHASLDDYWYSCSIALSLGIDSLVLLERKVLPV